MHRTAMENEPGGGGWGDDLRRARARKRVDLEQAFHETRISPVYLDLLERNAPMTAFPAPVYARAFLREYAAYLGLDSDALVERFEAAGPAPDPSLLPYETDAEHERRPRLARMWPARPTFQ
jgi:cytoskeletal protein RodZ